jgi:hypothetical protein
MDTTTPMPRPGPRRGQLTRRRRIVALALGAVVWTGAAAGPHYEPTRAELEQVLEDLVAWLPGAWDSYPQVYYERLVQAPKAGEHEHWHREFGRIAAPQIGTHVFYGQINVGGRSGPMMPRSQILYDAHIDEARGVVSIIGQSPADPAKYQNLLQRPELWKEVRQRDPAAVRCDFVWRRSGAQLVGVLEGRKEENRKYGPGTCTYLAGQSKDVEFYADAEWVLAPDELWLYDINRMAGHTFVGRDDRTHIRLYRARPFLCRVQDSTGLRTLQAYDRGWKVPVSASGGAALELLLLRASLPRSDGVGLVDRLRLTLHAPETAAPLATADAGPAATAIDLAAHGVAANCTVATRFGPLGPAKESR